MKTQINKIENDWTDAKNKCRTTVNKIHTDNEPSSEFKTNLLISEHSPVRIIKVNWIWDSIKSWVAVHWVRHKWECFVSTRRTDRTGIDRNKLTQDELVIFEGEANAQHLIDTWRKRLCFQASDETRQYAEDFKISLKEKEPELADALVPHCIYRFGCPEFDMCNRKFFEKFLEKNKGVNMNNIKERYKAYNDEFYRAHKMEE